MRQPRRQGQLGDGLAVLRQPALGVQYAEALQQGARLAPGGFGRRVEQGKAGRIPGAPPRQIERQPRKIGIEYFRPAERRQGAGFRLIPQAIADAGLGPPCPPSPLIGRGLTDAHRLQACQAPAGVIAGHT